MKELIDKDLLKEKLNTRIEVLSIPEFSNNPLMVGERSAYLSILSFLDTIEVKEVDLEKELETLDSLLYDLDGVAVKGTTSYLTIEDVKHIAKHFFGLGLKAKGIDYEI